MGRGKSADARMFWGRWDDLGIKDLALTTAAKNAGLKLSSSTISSYRTENRYPRANEAVVMARVGHTTVEYLETGGHPLLVSLTDRDFLEKARRWREVVERLDSLDPELAEKFTSLILAVPLSPMLGESLPRAEGE